MDIIYTILGGVGVLLLGALPLLFFIKRKKKSPFSIELVNLAAKSNCKISESTVESLFAIGIDYDSHYLFFIRKQAHNNMTLSINLLDVNKCKIANSNNRSGNSSVVDKRSLIIEYKEKEAQNVSLLFYDADQDAISIEAQYQNANKWMKIVEVELSKIANN